MLLVLLQVNGFQLSILTLLRTDFFFLICLFSINLGEHLYYVDILNQVYRCRNVYLTIVANMKALLTLPYLTCSSSCLELLSSLSKAYNPTSPSLSYIHTWLLLKKKNMYIFTCTRLFHQLNLITACVSPFQAQSQAVHWCWVFLCDKMAKVNKTCFKINFQDVFLENLHFL